MLQIEEHLASGDSVFFKLGMRLIDLALNQASTHHHEARRKRCVRYHLVQPNRHIMLTEL